MLLDRKQKRGFSSNLVELAVIRETEKETAAYRKSVVTSISTVN